MLTPQQIQDARQQLNIQNQNQSTGVKTNWNAPNAFVNSQPEKQTTPQPNPLSEVGGILSDTVKNTADIYKNAASDFLGNYITPEGDNASKLKDPLLNLAQNSAGGTMSLMKTIFAPVVGLTEATTTNIAKNIGQQQELQKNPVIGKIADFIQGSSDQLNKLATDHPEVARGLSNGLQILAMLAGGSGGEDVGSVEGIKKIPSDIIQGVKDTTGKVAEGGKNLVQGAKETLTNIQEGAGEKMTQGAKDEWAKPTTKPNASYSKATDIYKNALDKGHDISNTLVKNGIKISDNVSEGKFSTSDTAEKIRTDAGKTSNELLRPALEKADESVERTPVSDILNQTIKDIKSSKGETAGNIKSQVAQAEREFEALQEKYPKGMSLTDMHDEKISYSRNGGYKPMGTVADNNTAAMNRSFGRTLANSVETKSPEGIPVKEFNKELQKQYQAADYLDSLNNKKVPTSVGEKIAKTGAKVVGASVGAGLGGGVLGGVGGYHIGGMVEGLLEQLPAKFRDSFLNNLEQTNPEAFSKVQEYLKTEPPNLNKGEIPTTISKSTFKTINPIKEVPSEFKIYLDTIEKVKNGNIDEGIVAKLPQGNDLYINKDKIDNIIDKHGNFPKENFIITANEPTTVISGIVEKRPYITLIHEFEGNKAFVISARKFNGHYVVTYFEPTDMSYVKGLKIRKGSEIIKGK